jgi:hypothetical protein
MQGERTDLNKNKDIRFWDNVDIRDKDSCWIWKLSTSCQGYPTYGSVLAYRISYRLAYGEIPKIVNGRKVVIRHLCSNKRCVNPYHLELGNNSSNSFDRYRLEGAKKLTTIQVLHARYLRSQGQTYNEIAKLYNTSGGVISHAILGKGTYGEIV